MAEKKYTPREAAIAVLQKAEAMLKSSSLAKGEHQPHPGPSVSEHQKIYDAKKQAASEAHLKTPEGDAERQAKNKAMVAGLKKAEEDRSKMSGKTGMVRLDSESNQNQKGVHQHGYKGSSGGISEAGANVRDAAHSGGSAKDKHMANAKHFHQQALAEQKAMPKPNLPGGLHKEEPGAGGGSHSGGMKGPLKLATFMGRMEHKRKSKMTGHEKGVHPNASGANAGQSPAGRHLEGEGTAQEKQSDVKPMHQKVLNEQKAIKPKLPG